jgi:hypothetical protein
MAQVPYEHVEAPRVVRIDGVIAFNAGDPMPVDTARRLGLLDTEDAPPILPAFGIASSPAFTDAEIRVAAAEAAAGVPLADAGATNPTPTEGATNQATPPQAPAKAPKQGPNAAPTTP